MGEITVFIDLPELLRGLNQIRAIKFFKNYKHLKYTLLFESLKQMTFKKMKYLIGLIIFFSDQVKMIRVSISEQKL